MRGGAAQQQEQPGLHPHVSACAAAGVSWAEAAAQRTRVDVVRRKSPRRSRCGPLPGCWCRRRRRHW